LGIIGKLLGQGEPEEPAPEWASFFRPGGYHAFEALVRENLESRGLGFELLPEEGMVRLEGVGKESSQLGLGNLAQICNQSPRRAWTTIVSGHFDMVLKTAKDAEATWDRLAAEFEEARSIIKVRLYPADVANKDFMAWREPADGLIATLVYDLPQSVASVHKDHIEKWNRPLDELFEIGLANVKEEGLIEPTHFDVSGGAKVNAISSGSFFTASHSLFLGDYLSPENELGAVVSVPHRHTVLFHPIEDARAVNAMNAMIPAAAGMFQEGPGSVSPHLYWWHDGKLQRQHTEITANSIEFEPSEEFLYQVLNKIRV